MKTIVASTLNRRSVNPWHRGDHFSLFYYIFKLCRFGVASFMYDVICNLTSVPPVLRDRMYHGTECIASIYTLAWGESEEN